MISFNVTNQKEITEEGLNYLLNQAQQKSLKSISDIEGEVDAEILHPDVLKAINADSFESIIKDEKDTIEIPGDLISKFEAPGTLSMRLTAGVMSLHLFGPKFLSRWGRFKKKIRKVFCKIVSALSETEGIDWKDVIKKVVIALIPILAGTAGLMPVALSIVVALVAMAMNYGISKVCPV